MITHYNIDWSLNAFALSGLNTEEGNGNRMGRRKLELEQEFHAASGSTQFLGERRFETAIESYKQRKP